MESLLLGRHTNATSPNYDHGVASSVEGDTTCSEDEYGGATRSSTKLSVSSEPVSNRNRGMLSLYHGTWPVEKTMWNSEPTRLGVVEKPAKNSFGNHLEVTSVMSFASSSGGVPLDRVLGSPDPSKWSSQQLEAKMDVVHSLLAMLGGQDHVDMGETLLALSSCPESCLAMRQSGCIPLLVKLVQSDRDGDTRRKAAQALHNLVNSQTDEKLRKREVRVLKLTEQCRAYTDALRNNTEYEPLESSSSISEDGDKHPVQTVAHLMKLSFDEGHRQAICQLGGIYTIASLVEVEHTMHGSTTTESHCILMRRYACMALTNLTFGDSGNKALLCSIREFMRALVVQLQSPSDELRQVTASVLRNLSWRADSTSKEILREVGAVTGLMKAAMLDNKENTLKSILSALWNLSAHCTENKSEICSVENALGFLVNMLTYKTPSKSMAIIENSGGILRNISSQIAVREDYREILRKHNCLQILLEQLKSPSLTIVSNACGTLWNLSAKCATDQEILWELGAPSMLRSLNHSKHKMIAMGSSAALKNLLNAKPQQVLQPQLDSTALSLDLPMLPTLGARKQKALLQDLDQSLSETYDNIEKDSPVRKYDKVDEMIDFPQDSRGKSKLSSKSHFLDESQLCSNFVNLNLNEPSTSYTSDLRLTQRMQHNYGSSSLPYININKHNGSSNYIPVRNKFSDCSYEDEIDVSDQPIDYSKKYSETKLPTSDANNVSSNEEHEFSYSNQETEKENFSMYAETDLDQPTDYSLRYAEDDSGSEICSKITKNEPQEYVQDTVKTYCTEDTPYETPFNFSTATSMSDLRVDEKPVIDNDKQDVCRPKIKKETNQNAEEKDRCSIEDISELETHSKLCDKIPKSELSSGLLSPEKPVNYAEEGTPGYFSRVSSFGSLTSIPANENLKESKVDESPPSKQESIPRLKSNEKVSPKNPGETKAVKFERVVNYAEETPLMFSRSSSLASLDSIEQHSIHDDRSSVVSDFSRLPSGIVSPSELPDSPTQTVPPSPRTRQTSLDFPSTSKSRMIPEGQTHHAVRSIPKPGIFEDNVTKFKEESTPIQFSTATSLSSLTIDDHEETDEQRNSIKHNDVIQEEDEARKDEMEKKDSEKDAAASDTNDEFVVESEDDGDEDILADCISIGMPTNRHNQTNSSTSSSSSKLPLSNFKYTKTPPNQNVPLSSNTQVLPRPKDLKQHFEGQQDLSMDQSDTLRAYCTEDTPVRLSRTGSISDLSVLSELNESKVGSRRGDYLSDDSSNLSGDNDNILAECIQSALPKPKKEPPKAPAKSLPSCLPRRNIQTNSTIKYNPTSNLNHIEASKVRDINRRDNSLPPYLNVRDEVENYAVENSPCQFSLRSSLSDLTVDGSVAGLKRSGPSNQPEDSLNSVPSNSGNPNVIEQNASQPELSRRDSLSSISVESLESLEAEQALLKQCISFGMPKSNTDSEAKLSDIDTSKEGTTLTMGKSQSRDRKRQNEPETVQSKNVNAASVVGSITIQANVMCPNMSTAAAGVEENLDQEIGTKMEEKRELVLEEQEKTEIRTENPPVETLTGSPTIDTLPDKCLPSEEILYTDPTKSGSKEMSLLNTTLDRLVIEDRLARSCEDSNTVDNRMLDPEAMIESLDRFTAELVSQASHLNKDDDKYKASTGENTWNDDSSPNDVTFPSISGSAPNVITFSNEEEIQQDLNAVDEPDGTNEPVPEVNNEPSGDFLSINTSTLTDSTLIAIEASKMATVFKNEAEMSTSITSVASLDLDHIQPPSHMNSLSNSAVGLEMIPSSTPKLMRRKKSLPAGLMVRRALNNSSNHGSSLESLENHSLSNLDHVNPPFELFNDMDGSMTSVASLPMEMEQKTDFLINGILDKEPQSIQHPIFDMKHPFNELENINPPSLFNEITDFCNSLADVPTEAIGSITETFEDCYTYVPDSTMQDITLRDDLSQLSDAKYSTPLQSDFSSAEASPKKTKNLTKSMMTKQRRNLARDRYKTYTVAAEMVMKEESKGRVDEDLTEEFNTALDFSVEDMAPVSSTQVSPACNVGSKLTPREKRQMNRSRFETQVVDEALTNILEQPVIDSNSDTKSPVSNSNSCASSPFQSPARTKLSIRRNFMQKRLENKERFRTQTLSESSFSPDSSSASPPLTLNGETAVQLHLQKETDLILRTLRDTKTIQDDLIDCETLSLVSNDDESEHNSGGSANYRTYHKSWGFKKNIPIIDSSQPSPREPENLADHNNPRCSTEDENTSHINSKPKIVKPDEQHLEETNNDEEPKGIRGRRKPLYSNSNINNKISPRSMKPVRTVNSNLVKNVTSTMKSGTDLKSVISKQTKNSPTKVAVTQSKGSSSGYRSGSNSNSPKTSPARVPANKSSPKHNSQNMKSNLPSKGTPVLERQGTFTKNEPSVSSTSVPKASSKIPTPSVTTRIPTFGAKTARTNVPSVSKIPGNYNANKPPVARNGFIKSASSDRANKNMRIYNRSTSADSREPVSRIQTSHSVQNLKNDGKMQNGTVKKSSIPSLAQRTASNTSLNSNGSSSAKKQVTSKISSLWKKIEESKKQPPKKDTRVWIQSDSTPDSPRLIRSNTFDNKDGIILRNQSSDEDSTTKRISRLGSFVVMDGNDD
ncbi:uncharacterized protein isoform X2 [Leptinotarsa decemlineata]